MDPLLFLGSLLAILALAGLARWLGLGRAPRLADEAQARAAANEAVDGFIPIRTAIDRAGRGALLEDRQGRLLLLKPHGNFFAGRLLASGASAVHRVGQGQSALQVDSGERRYGSIWLEIDDIEHWVAAIERLRTSHNA